MSQVFAFEITVVDHPEWSGVVNHFTASKAKAEYYRGLIDTWPNIPFTALRARKDGGPLTSEQFVRNASYRGLPNARCGDRVKVGEGVGTIVGHNSSANFDVLFDEDSPKYPGMKLNCHPATVEFL